MARVFVILCLLVIGAQTPVWTLGYDFGNKDIVRVINADEDATEILQFILSTNEKEEEVGAEKRCDDVLGNDLAIIDFTQHFQGLLAREIHPITLFRIVLSLDKTIVNHTLLI